MILLIGADWCPACRRLKKTLEDKKVDFRYVRMPSGEEGWAFVKRITGRASIPQVFYHFGGTKEFKEATNKAELDWI